MAVWALRATGSNDDECLSPQIYNDLLSGKARYGWSYNHHLDLRKIEEKVRKHEKLDDSEGHAWWACEFLLKIQENDYLVYINLPKPGHCSVVKVLDKYNFDDGVHCKNFEEYAEDGRDFRHCFSVEFLNEFYRNSEFVPNNLNKRLKLQGRYWRIYTENELQDLLEILKKNRGDQQSCHQSLTDDSISVGSGLESNDDQFYNPVANEIDWIVQFPRHFNTYKNNIDNAKSILSVTSIMDASHKRRVLVMVYAYVISSVEQYLSEKSTYHIMNNDEYKRKFIASHSYFKEIKINLNMIFEEIENNLNPRIGEYLSNLVFHNIDKTIRPIYKSAFNYDFGDLRWLSDAVEVRHHCVHRAGCDKNGNAVDITMESIQELIRKIEEMINNVESTIIDVESLSS